MSRKRPLNRLRSDDVVRLGEWFAIASTALWVLEIKPASAITIVITLASFAATGQRILERSGARELGFGIGFVVGCSTYTLFAQVLLLLGMPPSISHWVAVGVPSGLAILSSQAQTDNSVTISHVVNRLPLSALSLALLVVALRHTWLMPFAFGVASYERIIGSVNLGAKWRILSIIAAVLGAGASTFLRPNRWWYFYQGNDAQFFESLGWSIARWSVLEHPGFSGGSVARYHWLTYAFFGGLGELAQLQPWDGLLKIGILILPATLALLILESPRNRKKSLAVSQGLLVLIVVAATPSTRVDSFTFSILVSFAFIILSGMEFDHRRRVMQIALFTLLSVALTFAKVSTAVIVGAILTVTTISKMMQRKRVSLMPALSLAGVFVVLYLWLFRENDAESLSGFQLNIAASMEELRSLFDNPFLATHFLIWIVLLTLLGARKEQGLSSTAFATLGIAVFALLTHIALVGPTTSYFGLPAVYLFSLLAVRERYEPRVVIDWRAKRLILPLVLFGAIAAGFGLSTSVNRIDLRFQLTEHFGAWPLDVVRGSGLTLSIIALLLFASIRIGARRPLLYAIAVVAALGIFSGQLMNGYRQAALLGAGSYTSSRVNAAAFGSGGLDEVSRYVRRTTPRDAILASNNFCCFGDEWFPQDGEARVRSAATIGETSLGGANYLLPANTRRRFLVQGLRFQTGYRPPSQDQANRVRLSLSFANNPSQQDADGLRRCGVSGFVVNLALTSRRDWSEFAVERFRSDEFVYLELK